MPLIARLGSFITSQIINSFPNKKLLNYSYIDQLKDILPEILIAVVMGFSVYWLKYLPIPLLSILLIQIVAGALIYILLSKLFKLESFYYLLNYLKTLYHDKSIS